jgi:ABC-type nitrate/sulfonate/bicarbonate transport system permease component
MIAEALGRTGLLPVFLPVPSQMITELVQRPELWFSNLGPTTVRAVTGFFVAVVAAGGAAAAAVSWSVLIKPVYNFGVTLYSIPIIATAPLLAVWLGTGAPLQVIIAALACQFPILVGTMQGLRAANVDQRELMHTLSASRLQTLRYLFIPSALPYFFAGLKIAAPSAVLGAVTAEWTGAERGIGVMMLYALFSYDVVKVWLSVVATCVLAAIGYGIWAAAESSVIFWNRSAQLAE